MIFFVLFILSFLSADYLLTGSVTSTWIGIAIISGATTTLLRRVLSGSGTLN